MSDRTNIIAVLFLGVIGCLCVLLTPHNPDLDSAVAAVIGALGGVVAGRATKHD